MREKIRTAAEEANGRRSAEGGPATRSAARLIDRRGVLVAGAAAATAAVAPELSGAATTALTRLQPESTAAASLSWQPRCLDSGQAQLLSRLCDLLLPRTATPGANDAGVPEWIDLAVSLAEPDEQLAFLGGLGWIERRSHEQSDRPFLQLSMEQQVALLHEISDEHAEHPPELEAGAAFFADLKAKVLFAYFTSKTARVETLGLPETVEREIFRGCTHGNSDEHQA